MSLRKEMDAARASRYLTKLVGIARERSTCTQKHAALIYRAGKVLSVGINKLHNDPSNWIDIEGISTHAEIDAIRKVKDKSQLRGAVLYVARVSKGGNVALSKPCHRCQQVIEEVGIKKVIHT